MARHRGFQGALRMVVGRELPPHVPGHPVEDVSGFHACAGLDGQLYRNAFVIVAWRGLGPMHAPVWWDPAAKRYSSRPLAGRILMKGWWVHLGPQASTPALATVYVP